jgi:hypothetical protein
MLCDAMLRLHFAKAFPIEPKGFEQKVVALVATPEMRAEIQNYVLHNHKIPEDRSGGA